MLAIYMQRSLFLLFICCVLFLPIYLFITLVLKLLGQLKELTKLSSVLFTWLIQLHLSFCVSVPSRQVLAWSGEVATTAWVSLLTLLVTIYSEVFVIFLPGYIGIARRKEKQDYNISIRVRQSLH